MIETYREKISETGKCVLEIINKQQGSTGETFELTTEQVLDIISLQEKVFIENGSIIVKNKKKRGGKLDIKKFSQKFTSKK